MTKFDFAGQHFTAQWWSPAVGVIGAVVAVDTETEATSAGVIPRLVLLQAYAGGAIVYLVRNEDVPEFFRVHDKSSLVMHNAAFDVHVLESAVGIDFDSAIRDRRLWDTGLLYRLLGLAKNGEVPQKWNLAELSRKFLDTELAKDSAIRMTFGEFLRPDGTVDYEAVPLGHLVYAAMDVIATLRIFEALMPAVEALDPVYHLSHKIQLMGTLGLRAIELNGIGFDDDRRAELLTSLDEEITRQEAHLVAFDYVPGSSGVNGVLQRHLAEIESQHGVSLPRTGKTKMISSDREVLGGLRHLSPFIDAVLKYREKKKLKDFVLDLKGPRVHSHFDALKATGRTSSWGPNLQNLPRLPGVRECFTAAKGHVLLIIDYAQLELCTLAQVCIDRFGSSKMADLINDNRDLHRWFASVLLGKLEANVTKVERQLAKACNFGFPGGLGVPRFLDYARTVYGIDNMTIEDATRYRELWIEAFPEMRRYLDDDALGRLEAQYDFGSARTMLGDWAAPEIASRMFLRIVKGHTHSTRGQPYSDQTMEWALQKALPQVAPKVGPVAVGSREIGRAVAANATVTARTGRVRARCGYCEARNTRFQGLAADGAKVAAYRLNRASHSVVNFIHDELIFEVPQQVAGRETCESVEDIATRAMRTVVPDVTIRCEWFYAPSWTKTAPKSAENVR